MDKIIAELRAATLELQQSNDFADLIEADRKRRFAAALSSTQRSSRMQYERHQEMVRLGLGGEHVHYFPNAA